MPKGIGYKTSHIPMKKSGHGTMASMGMKPAKSAMSSGRDKGTASAEFPRKSKQKMDYS